MTGIFISKDMLVKRMVFINWVLMIITWMINMIQMIIFDNLIILIVSIFLTDQLIVTYKYINKK